LTETENTFRNSNTFRHSQSASIPREEYNEKDITDSEAKALDDEHHDDFAIDPFKPFDDLPEERKDILTVRAVFVGLCCGALVNASNIYLGLKTGWTFTANLFGVSSCTKKIRAAHRS
jgi:hypothetical protein